MVQKTLTRAVLDTSVVLSALLFPRGKLTWIRSAWSLGKFMPLVSPETTRELIRTLGYPKFDLSAEDIEVLLADYLTFAEAVTVVGPRNTSVKCRDPSDRIFLDLAYGGHADTLVSSDRDLLVLAGETPFAIETWEAFRRRIG